MEKGKMSRTELSQNQGQEGREFLDNSVFRYSVGAEIGGKVRVVGTSIDGTGMAMFDDFIERGNKIPSIIDYEGQEALPVLTGIIDQRMKGLGVPHYQLDVRRNKL